MTDRRRWERESSQGHASRFFLIPHQSQIWSRWGSANTPGRRCWRCSHCRTPWIAGRRQTSHTRSHMTDCTGPETHSRNVKKHAWHPGPAAWDRKSQTENVFCLVSVFFFVFTWFRMALPMKKEATWNGSTFWSRSLLIFSMVSISSRSIWKQRSNKKSTRHPSSSWKEPI